MIHEIGIETTAPLRDDEAEFETQIGIGTELGIEIEIPSENERVVLDPGLRLLQHSHIHQRARRRMAWKTGNARKLRSVKRKLKHIWRHKEKRGIKDYRYREWTTGRALLRHAPKHLGVGIWKLLIDTHVGAKMNDVGVELAAVIVTGRGTGIGIEIGTVSENGMPTVNVSASESDGIGNETAIEIGRGTKIRTEKGIG